MLTREKVPINLPIYFLLIISGNFLFIKNKKFPITASFPQTQCCKFRSNLSPFWWQIIPNSFPSFYQFRQEHANLFLQHRITLISSAVIQEGNSTQTKFNPEMPFRGRYYHMSTSLDHLSLDINMVRTNHCLSSLYT